MFTRSVCGSLYLTWFVSFIECRIIPASKTSEADLEKRLRPVEQQPFNDGCLEGTRVNVLHEARDWLKDNNSAQNILWILGAPGAGSQQSQPR